MPYTELIKNFNRTREYMREFFVFGFRSREEVGKKSARSYDDERRRVESWLGEYMQFRRMPDGKNVFLSIDSRAIRSNPLYKAWKAKSFTDGDITLHFILLDILSSPKISLTLNEITEAIDGYLSAFEEPRTFDASTVRKQLKEYADEGIIIAEKRGRSMTYRRAEDIGDIDLNALAFFSETAPCGVIGSYLIDRKDKGESVFTFKHHCITFAMDTEIVCGLFLAMREKRFVTIEVSGKRGERFTERDVVPLKILRGVQTGRQYLMAYVSRIKKMIAFRTDGIISVEPGEICESFDEHRAAFASMKRHLWGASTRSRSGDELDHVEFTVRYEAWEKHIHQRLEREKRCGTVERIDEHHSGFSADVYDASELVPWIRTFICRITELHISDKLLEARFLEDIKAMYRLYGLGGDTE